MSDQQLSQSLSRKRLAAALVLGAVMYLVFLLALAPASVVAWSVSHFSHQQAHLKDVSGSLWHGRARTISVKAAGGQAYQLSPLTWKISFGQLLHGQLLADIAVGQDAAASRAVIAISRHRLQLEQFHSPLPAVVLKTMVPQLDVSKITGGGQ